MNLRASYNHRLHGCRTEAIVPDMNLRASYNGYRADRAAVFIVPDMNLRASYNKAVACTVIRDIVPDMNLRASYNVEYKKVQEGFVKVLIRLWGTKSYPFGSAGGRGFGDG